MTAKPWISTSAAASHSRLTPIAGHRRIVPPDQPPPDRADLAAVRPVVLQVDRVDGQAGQLLGRAARRAQRGQQVGQRLLELRGDRVSHHRAGGSSAVWPARKTSRPPVATTACEKPDGVASPAG